MQKRLIFLQEGAQGGKRSALQWSESGMLSEESPGTEAPSERANSEMHNLSNESDLKILPRRLFLCTRGTFSGKLQSLKRLFASSKEIERKRERNQGALGLSVNGAQSVAAWILHLLAFGLRGFSGCQCQSQTTQPMMSLSFWFIYSGLWGAGRIKGWILWKHVWLTTHHKVKAYFK